MTVEELKVKLMLETKDFNKQADASKRSLGGVGDAATSVREKLSRITEPAKSVGNMSREYRRLQNAIEKTSAKIVELEAKQKALGDKGKVPTEAYAKLQAKLQDLQKEYDKLSDIGDSWIDMGLDPGSDKFSTLDKSLAEVDAKMRAVEKDMADLEQRGGAFTPSAKFEELERKIKASREELERYTDEQNSLGAKANPVSAVSGRFQGLGARIKALGANAVKSFKETSNQARIGLGRILRYAIGIRSLFALFGKLKSYIREGFSNLSQYSGQTSRSLAQLRGSLTQVKNSLAVAFAPIVTAIAPYVQTLVNLITTACNALAQFFGALTGQKTVTIAKANLGDISTGASGAAGATKSANDAAKEYQKTLMGFDQINKLDDTGASSGSGGGGGGSAGGVGGAAGFTTSEIDNVYSGWAEKVKEAWKNADFYDIGQALGTKIRDGLESINWDKIKAVGGKIAKSLATGLNGFLETPGLFTAIGSTVAEALNTVFNTANTFAKAFHWSSLGKAISDSINGFFSTFNFKLAGNTISNWAKGILDTAISAVKNVDWGQVGAKIADFISGIDWAGIIEKGIELAGMVVKGVAEFSLSFVKNIISDILTWLYNVCVGHNQAVMNIKLGGKEDPTFSKVKKEYDSTKDKPATVTTKGVEHKSWVSTQKDFNSVKTKTATVTLKASGKIDSNTKTISNLLNAKKSKTFTFSSHGGGKITLMAREMGGLFMNGHWKPVTAAANGGSFSEGQAFIARERGPEMVGTIGRHSAVVNNGQIVASIADGVYRAVVSAMAGSGKETTLNVTLAGDAGQMFRVIRKEAQNYTNATGLSPFPV